MHAPPPPRMRALHAAACAARRAAAAGRLAPVSPALSIKTAAVASEAAAAAPTAPAVPTPRPSFRAHIDFRALKADLPAARANVAARNSPANPDAVVALYDAWRAAADAADAARAERNAVAAQMKGKLDADKRATLVAQGKALKERVAELEAAAAAAEDALQAEAQRLPNAAHPEAPVGGEEAAVVVNKVGNKPSFTFTPSDHLALGTALDVIDFDAGAVAAGSKFVYLKRAAAQLELALCTWALGRATAAGFIPMTTPDLVKESVLEKCGFQPRGDETQIYSVADSNLCLTGTAEVPLGAVHMDSILDAASLPIKMAAFGHCFRTEAGASGSASRGLYRVHQFSKVELFIVATPEQSDALLADLVAFEESLFTDLGLHFRTLDMPTGDLGAPAHRKYDIEAWMPGLERYGEVSSASNCTDYQARRLNIRYRAGGAGGSGATAFVHTLNATAAAVPRLVVAILENFQDENGWVTVPEVLRPFMGGVAVIKPPE